MNNKNKNLSVSAVIIIVIVTSLIFNSAFMVFMSYRENRNVIIEQSADKVMVVAQTIAAQIDPVRYEAIALSGVRDEYWYEVRDLLHAVAHYINAHYVYSLLPNFTDVVTYFADTQTPNSDHEPFGLWDTLDVEFYPPEMFITMRDGIPTRTGIVDAGEFGRSVCGFAPIFSHDGRIIGIISVEVQVDDVFVPLRNFVFFISLAALLVTAVTAIIAIYIVRARVTKPLNVLIGLVSNVTQGRLSFENYNHKLSNDEIGILTNDMLALVNVIRNMVDDLMKIDHNFNTLGDIDYRIDVTKYQNTFREMMEGVNNIPNTIVADVMTTIDSIDEINKGNFNPNVKYLVGKKMVLTNAILDMLANLNNVNAGISQLIELAAVKGDLSFQIDANKYNGDWREIMQGLNNLIKIVDRPLSTIKLCLGEMSVGNFNKDDVDKKLGMASPDSDANLYQGIYKEMGESIDTAMSTVASYINEVSGILAQMAEGNLQNKIEREYVGTFDLLKRSINQITDNLHKTMKGISIATDQVLIGANQISISALELSTGAQEQSGSIEELNATIEMISQQTHENAKNATTANELSNKSTTNAQEGSNAMKHMVDAMSQIKESSNNISQIVKTVQDIAFQTNLLALNASVEAARAGDHGKGFAVVADEVRTLAGRSQAAATQTTTLIQDSINRVETGSSIAETTEKSLNAIVVSAGEVLAVISSISDASKEQAEAIEQISSGIAQISNVTQTNSAISEETAAASEELNSQTETLRQLVAFFKL
ncbi:MAG: methyl-accepting chemotaxis protein [Defluviitaleaceae bacterium]|nr:methyl-accepting chemotaxis protein [Defluviitaleaceae bacterium]